MAGQSDGSIIIDAEMNPDGLKAGSEELLTAIKSLSDEVKTLGATLKSVFEQSFTPRIDTSDAEARVGDLESQVKELQTMLDDSSPRGPPAGSQQQSVSMDGPTQKASSLQRQIEAVNDSVAKLEPTFQQAMSGSESAMASFEGKASKIEDKMVELREKLDALAEAQIPTDEYKQISDSLEQARVAWMKLIEKKEKYQALGVKENSAQWRSLQYDLQAAVEEYNRLAAAKDRMEQAGTAFTSGVDTSQYQQLDAELTAAATRLAEMQHETQRADGAMRGFAAAARQALGFIGAMVSRVGSGLVSGLRAAANGVKRIASNSSSATKQFSGLISGAKKFTMSLLGARGVYALLRKAVSAYMAENQALQNTLNGCWTGIGNLLGPIIERLINLVATAVSYITSFLGLFGTFGNKAKKSAKQAGGAAKELKGQLASFDELNILSEQSTGGGGGADTDKEAKLPEVELPDWAKQLADQMKVGAWEDAAKTLTTQLNAMVESVDWAGIGQKAGAMLDDALTFLATAITTFDWYGLGSSLGTAFNNLLYNVDWANLGVVLGAKFIILIRGLGGLFATFDWAALGNALSSAFMGLWNAIDWSQAAKMVSDGIIGVLTTLSTAIKNVDWQKLGSDIATFIASLDWSGITAALFDGLGAAVGGLSAFLWGLISDAWDSVVTWWYDVAYDDGGFTMSGLLKGIWDGICNIGSWIVTNIFEPFINGFKAAFGIHSPSTVMEEQGGYIISGLLQGITAAWNTITDFFGKALSSIGDTISTTWSKVKSGTSSIWNNVKSGLSSTWTSTNTLASQTWSNLSSTVSDGWKKVKSNTTSLWSNIKSDLSSTWNTVKSNASSAWSNIESTISEGWLDIKSNTASMWNGISAALTTAWTNIKSTASSSWSSLKATVSNGWANIKANTESDWSAISTNLGSTWNSIKSTASSLWSGIKSTISAASNAVKSTITGNWSATQNDTATTWSSIKSTLSGAWNSLQSTASSKFRETGSTISGTFYSLKNDSWTWGKDLVQNMANGIKNTVSTLKSAVSKAASTIKSYLGFSEPETGPLSNFHTYMPDMIDLMVAGIKQNQRRAIGAVSDMAAAISGEIQSGDYGMRATALDVDSSLSDFSNRISDSFVDLVDKLQAIADKVAFQVPAVANGVIPYAATSSPAARTERSAENGNALFTQEDLLSAIAQVGDAIVQAIMDKDNTVIIGDDMIHSANARQENKLAMMRGV